MPVHIDYRHGEWNILFTETIHQRKIAFFIIGIKTTPPVSENVVRKQRGQTGQGIQRPRRANIIMPIAKKVDIRYTIRALFNPTLIIND